MLNLTPLRLEWRLTSPVSGMSLPLHLDALVAYAVTEEALRYGQPAGDIRQIALDLPLERCARDGLACWKASALLAQTVKGHEMQMWTRKFPEEEYAKRFVDGQFSDVKLKRDPVTNDVVMKPFSAIIDTLRGQTKNHYQFIPVRHVDRFVAYCIGDMDRLTELLSPQSGYVTSIGSRKRQGNGNIHRGDDGFTIVEDEAALTMWEQRVLPWPKEGYEPIQAAHDNPYWAIENRAISFIHPSLL